MVGVLGGKDLTRVGDTNRRQLPLYSSPGKGLILEGPRARCGCLLPRAERGEWWGTLPAFLKPGKVTHLL